MIRKVKNTVLWRYVIGEEKGKKLLERFTKRIAKKQIKKSIEMKK